MNWNFRKPLKQNFIKNNLKFVCPNGNFFEPWKNEDLNKHLIYDIIAGEKFLSLFVDDEDICSFLHPDNPSSCYFQTSLLKNETSLRLKMELTEDLKTKLIAIRNEADVLNKDVVSICYEEGNIHIKQDDVDKLVFPFTIDEDILDIRIDVFQNHIQVKINEYEINIDETIEEDYWICFGMVNTPKKTYNNIRIYSYELN